MNTKPRNETPPPSDRKGLDRRLRVEDFLQGAERLFAERGYGRTTMEDIARLAGYGTGTICRYFESKETLCGELIERKMATLLDHLRGQCESQASPWGKMWCLMRGNPDFFRRNRRLVEAESFMVTFVTRGLLATTRLRAP